MRVSKSLIGRKHLLTLKIFLTVIILITVVLRVDVGRIGAAFQSLRAFPFMLALFLIPINLAVQFYRWHFVLKTANCRAAPKDVFRSVLAGLALSLVTPGRIGEVGRSLYVTSSNATRIAGLVVLEKAFAFVVILIASGFSIILWGGRIAGIFLIMCGLTIALNINLIRAVLSRVSFLLPDGKKVAELWSAWNCFGQWQSVYLLAISMGFFSIIFLQFYALVSSFETVTFLPALISIPLTMAINSLPFTVAGLGLREGAAVFFFSKFGVAEATALNGAFLLFVIDILVPVVISLPFVSRAPLRFERLDEEKRHP